MSKKIEAFWVNATAFEVARVMNGETVEARFRDDEGGKWLESDHSLGGYDSTEEVCKWISSTGCPWRYCQVYREPSWHANKPDPGPGFRLLEKFPPEELQPEDDWWGVESKDWLPSRRACRGEQQDEDAWYRRRIEQLLSGHRWLANGDRLESGDLYYEKGVLLEVGHEYWGDKVMLAEAFMRKIEQPKPEPKHYVLRVGDSVETPCGNRVTVMPQGSTQRFLNAKAGDTIKTTHGQTITITEKGFEVTQ
jgi:hypothetical protein